MYSTEQEQFWSGDFGKEYITRNNSDDLIGSKINLWSKIISRTENVKTVRELGCNIGLNLKALKILNPHLDMYGVEINVDAAKIAETSKVATINVDSILSDFTQDKKDLVFTSGVLIHIDPNSLDLVYKNLVEGSNKYIVVIEYYNPTPVSIVYRGHENKLFKRDFAGELIDKYHLKLIDYGFQYRRDNNFPQDDCTWFLLEK